MLCREKKHRRNNFILQEAVHEPEYQNLKKPHDTKTEQPLQRAHRLEINLEPDVFTEEKFNLFAHYQRTVHKEPPSKISRAGFKSFLCSGLVRSTFVGDGKERNIGSYHSCYRIDGRLMAMGVLDLTPHCVSSVYLIYHEDVNTWNFGKLSAMYEIAMAID